ncbi:hypothetical protein C1H46_038261 [Malus baccata]|uniref:Uncharacterized protein n=1 Tax=Malus baccata TaxID=106549 RepID=A0A540KPS7_MALBA|nr:hypothetical protein C1H46_038261 [Malus baccata]
MEMGALGIFEELGLCDNLDFFSSASKDAAPEYEQLHLKFDPTAKNMGSL